mgnify:CR=1 FL=1
MSEFMPLERDFAFIVDRAVRAGDVLLILEAMKMEQPLTAHKSGKISKLIAEIGETVASGTALCQILD